MYDELVKSLHACGTEDGIVRCVDCHEEFVPGCSCSNALMRKAADAIEKLIEVIQNHDFLESLIKPRWIPVTERLPDAYEDVLLEFPNNQAAGFCDRDGCWAVYSGNGFYTEVAENEPEPTHWAKKLPEPPKEEE